MDALDGGFWQYGDDSMPTVGVTYFAGTFVRHPLALAAAKASLEHLKEAGPSLQADLNARTAAMAEELNTFFALVGAPLEDQALRLAVEDVLPRRPSPAATCCSRCCATAGSTSSTTSPAS